MYIHLGIGSFKELDYFLNQKNPPQEFYAGISKIPSHVEGAPNFEDESEIIKAASIARSEKRKFFFVANEITSSNDSTIETIKILNENSIDGFIIKDLTLLKKLKENKIKTYIILSTLTNITNARAALFYKKNYSINRIALAEQLFGIEAKKIIKLIDTEIFLKHRESCRNFNGLCFLDCHRADSTPCLKKYSKHFIMPQISEEKNLRDLYNFIRWGTRTIKIGRSPLYQLTNLLFFEARTLIELIKNSKNEEEFVKYALKFTKEYSKVYKKFTPRYGVF